MGFFTARLKLPAVIEDVTTVGSVAKWWLAYSLLALQIHAISATELHFTFPVAIKLHEMAMWGDVELLTNEDTITVRLSSVSKEENASGLYQVDTLVKISTANEVTMHLLTYRR